jgi:tRNA dimethylallyltransferase
MQVYQGMDIGTAKPGREVRERLPHHLIDVADPSHQFSVGEFVRRADELVEEIAGRGRLPVVSGGTAFYLRGFLYGLPQTPRQVPEIRGGLKRELLEKGPEALLAELERTDPQSAARIPRRDIYRVLRALEVVRSTGRPLSSIHVPQEPRGRFRTLLIGLEREREDLYRRIEARVDRMFEQGLVAEVAALIERGYTEEDPGMQGIGYREFFSMRRGCPTLADTRERIRRNTRRYAKRQITFFRSLPGVHWLHREAEEEIRGLIDRFLRG